MASGCLPDLTALDLMSALKYRMCIKSYIKLSEISTIVCKCFYKSKTSQTSLVFYSPLFPDPHRHPENSTT